MTLDEYQREAITYDLMKTNDKNPQVTDPAYMAKVLGLLGEAGEVAEKFKKIIRDKEGIMSAEDQVTITKELGDVMWYASAIAQYMGVSLEAVGQTNLEKLGSRKKRGVQRGSGDNR